MTADVAGFVAAAEAGDLTDKQADEWLLQVTAPKTSCRHEPECPAADHPDHDSAKVVAHDYTVGYSVLCNGVVVFEDTGELVGTTPIEPHRPEPQHRTSEES